MRTHIYLARLSVAMKEECCDNNQLIPYGYSIFTYMNQYDQAWMIAIKQLKEFLSLPQSGAQTHGMQTKPLYQRHTVIQYFPDESVYSVMSYLEDVDLCVICTVSKAWNQLSNRDELWNNLLRKHFSVSSSDIVVKSIRKRATRSLIPSKVIYKEMYQTLRGVLEGLQGPKMKQPVVSASLHHGNVIDWRGGRHGLQ